MALRTVGVRLSADVSGYMNGMRAASSSTKDFIGQMDKAARAGKLDAVADRATGMGLALAGGFALAVSAAAKFDKQMSAVSAATHASVGDMEKLRAAALQAGKDTAFSATEAAQGIEELSKAGVSTAAILSGGLKGALDLAAAGELSVGEAAETAASAITQFKLSGKDVPHIADLLAAGAGKAQGSVHDMGQALNQTGLVAAQTGLTIEETTGGLAAFASAGLTGSDAGTSFKQMLLMLQAPSGKTKTLMDELGVSLYDTSGNAKGLAQFAGELRVAMSTLTPEVRANAMAQIFGADAVRGASILYEQGAEGVQSWIDKTNDAGYAAETARIKTDNLAGDIERLKGSLETLAIESGSGANGGLRVLTQAADALAGQLSSMPSAVGTTVTVLAGLSAAVMLGGAGWVKARRSAAEFRAELTALGPAGARTARGLAAVGSAASKVGTAFLLLEVAGAVVHHFVGDLNPQIDAMAKGMERWAKGAELSGEAARVLGDDFDDLNVGLKFLADTDNSRRQWARGLQEGLEGLIAPLRETNTSLTRTQERVTAMDQTFAQLVQGGKPEAAEAAFNRLAASQAKFGVSTEELRKQFPEYAAAVETAGDKSGEAATGVDKVGGAAKDAAKSAKDMKEAFDALFGVRMSQDEALIAYRQGIKDLNEELETGKRTLDTNSQAGRDNASAMLEQVNKIKDLRQARIDNGATMADADAKYKSEIAAIRKHAVELGFDKVAIDQLINKYYEVPDLIQTPVTTPGLAKATSNVQNFNFVVRSVPPSKTVPFWATTEEAKAAVEALRLKIAEIKSKHVYITGSVRWESDGDLKVPGGTLTKDRWGGVHEGGYTKAAQGVLRDATVFGPRSPGRYMFAEPETGGELFAPKYGNQARTKAMVSHAIENWWGGWRNFMPSSAYAASPMGTGSGAPNHYYFQPQQASVSLADFEAFQRRQDALTRLGRSR